MLSESVVVILSPHLLYFFFFFTDTASTAIYTLSLHDALPVSSPSNAQAGPVPIDDLFFTRSIYNPAWSPDSKQVDRKSTRLNSSHANISYAVFCLKKKKNYPACEDQFGVRRSIYPHILVDAS